MIYCVEDDSNIRELLLYTLHNSGFEAKGIEDGEALFAEMAREKPSLILLDVMLPGIDGFGLMEYIAPTGTPVIFLSARSSVEDRVKGLRLGAYDYIVKPFAPEELLARVDGLMRHTGRRSASIRLWDVSIDPAARAVTRKGEPVELTPREYDLLMVLVQSRGIALYRSVLLERVWGLDSDTGPRALDLYISRLRKKLGWGDKIRTVSGVGYRLEAEP